MPAIRSGGRARSPARAAERASLVAALVLCSCASSPELEGDVYAGASASVLPNFGVALEAGQVFARTSSTAYSFEVEATSQFFDDKTFSDNGDPEAGDWVQFQGGFKALIDAQDEHAWAVRWGGVWFRAEGEPNIVQEAGDYLGLYGSLGFETRLSRHWSMGPEFSLFLVTREKSDLEVDVVPQFNWHVIWSL